MGYTWEEHTTRHPIIDPLYGPIECDDVARAIIDTPAFQRLRRIRQLSLAGMVYPGAQHTRFEHAIGVYALAKRILRTLADRGDLDGFDEDDLRLICYAALCHDLGHHGGGSHSLEDSGVCQISHEEAGARFFLNGEVADILAATGIPDIGNRIAKLIRHESDHPLVGLVSGDCDPDKLDYLRRDAYHCGIDAGFDQERLCAGMRVLVNPNTGRREVGIDHAVLLPFERMLYAKNTLYREVYFHPVVVSATAMLRSLVVTALSSGLVAMEEIQDWTDEEVLMALALRVGRRRKETDEVRLVGDLIDRLRTRRLYSIASSLPQTMAPVVPRGKLVCMERRLAHRLGMAPGSVLLDVPHKPSMLSTDILVQMSDGEVRYASELGPEDGFAMNAMRDVLCAAAFRIRLFTAERIQIPPDRFRELLADVVEEMFSPT